jgi:hypothetical protein
MIYCNNFVNLSNKTAFSFSAFFIAPNTFFEIVKVTTCLKKGFVIGEKTMFTNLQYGTARRVV